MSPWLEIVLPIRNPGSRLEESVASILAQSTRGFGVVLSDNWSTTGLEQLDQAQRLLEEGGVTVRRVRPSFELGRVQHWNWAHLQGRADWLKPLFVGDLLLPRCVERLRERACPNSPSSLIRFEFELRRPGVAPFLASAPCREPRLSPHEFLQWFPTHGNWIGGPVNVAYRRDAFVATGGYLVAAPACADYGLFSALGLRDGLELIHEPLAVFQLHEQRFSHGIAKRRVNGYLEYWVMLRQATEFCRRSGLQWPLFGATRSMAREFRDHWWRERMKKGRELLLGRVG